MSTFGQKIDHHFHQQANTTSYIYVGFDESSTNACQQQFSIFFLFIKPYIGSLDMESFIMTWFTCGDPFKGQVALHKYINFK